MFSIESVNSQLHWQYAAHKSHLLSLSWASLNTMSNQDIVNTMTSTVSQHMQHGPWAGRNERSFNGHFSTATWVSRLQNVSILDFIGAKDDEGGGDRVIYVQSYSQIVTTNKPTPSFFTGQMPFLSPNQQCQSTERMSMSWKIYGNCTY